MMKEEIWSVPIHRVRTFFREQKDMTEESIDCFTFGTCRVTLTELKPRDMGIWTVKQIRVHMEGGDADVESVYHRFFNRFLSIGG